MIQMLLTMLIERLYVMKVWTQKEIPQIKNLI